MANYHSLFWLNPLPSWVFCTQTLRFLEVNQAAIDLYEYSREEFLSMTIRDIRPPEELEHLENNLSTLNLNQPSQSEIWLHKTHSGKLIYAELLAQTITWDKKQARLVVIKDISKQLESESALKQSEYNYRLLTESTVDLIIRFNKEIKPVFANHATFDYFSLPPEFFIGKSLTEQGFKKEEVEHWEKQIKQVFETGIKHQEITAIDEINRYVNWSLIPEKSSDGKTATVLSYSRDITELIHIRDQLTKNEKELKEINAEKDRFVKIIAHDLRSPFQGLISLSQLLAENLKNLSPEKVQEYTNRLNKLSVNLYQLVDNLLEWATIRDGKKEFKPVLLNVLKEVNLCVSFMEEGFQSKNIELKLTIPRDASVVADQKMFQTIIRNLLSNALKFTFRNGLVTLVATTNELETSIQITDTGMGISQDLLKQLFQVGEKTGRSGTENETSTGLGLPLIKEYMDQHQGKIRIQSAENSGTTISLQFPNPTT